MVVEGQRQDLVLVLPGQRGAARRKRSRVDVEVAGHGDRVVLGLPLALGSERYDQERAVREQLGDDAAGLLVAQIVESQRPEQTVVEVGGTQPLGQPVFHGYAHRVEPEDLVYGMLTEPLRL